MNLYKKIFLFCLCLTAFSAAFPRAEEKAAEEATPPAAVAADAAAAAEPAPPPAAPLPGKGPGPLRLNPISKLVYVIPIHEGVDEPLVYLVRRGIKEAASKQADLIILDMKTPGGKGTSMREIMEILERSAVRTLTFVNNEAFSAGAFIAVATQHIYMAPGGLIGAAAPMMVAPGGPMEMPETVERKIVSAYGGMIRSAAQKNGYNPYVVNKMVDRNAVVPFEIAGRKLEKGEILTLTSEEAIFEVSYREGEPPRPILSSGTVKDLEELLQTIGLEGVQVMRLERTGAEQLAKWINVASPILLILGILGAWFEIKTQGFGIIGALAMMCFLLFFFGQYIAALAGLEHLLVIVFVFLLGVGLVLVDIFLLPGTVVVGLVGLCMMVTALLFAMVDWYPGGPALPRWQDLQRPLVTMAWAVGLALVVTLFLGRFLPNTPMFHHLVLEGVSGAPQTAPVDKSALKALEGTVGVTVSPLRPAGKAKFGEELVDVVTQGEMLPLNSRVKVVGVEGSRVIVAEA